ncbi:DUF1254 domain-containing protein [Neobacillus niacini]|uniref:DUF1254 domain-containing protein n=1 Tax=Neobacillus niacini TaxID=86668 RepID=UPI0021CB6E0A|nr:DUF1254 domain-containing protein [Neobacillus niacini]MCM3766179.1 DUF1254 domain-containing protein [Neobacillus niacini]
MSCLGGESFDDNKKHIYWGKKDVYTLALRAYIWGYPLISSAVMRLNLTQQVQSMAVCDVNAGAPLNHVGHGRSLFNPNSKGIGPNNDTLYSLAWLDLSQEPMVLETPKFGNRYYTFQLALADTSTSMSAGQRTNGGQLPPLFIYGPAYHGTVPTGMLGVPSYTRYCLIAGRFLVNGPEDLEAVHKLQDQIRLRSWSDYLSGTIGEREVPKQRPLSDPERPVHPNFEFLEMLGNVLRDWVITNDDERKLIESFQSIGLTQERGFDPDSLSQETKAEMIRGLADGKKTVEEKSLNLGTNVNGWTINYAGPRFGKDYLLRAAVCKDQRHVTLPEEALYPLARVDASGIPLDGSQQYRIRMAVNELPPVDAFWSITLYNDSGAMVENPINRYSIGDRTPGLIVESDGCVDIRLQHQPPKSDVN